MRIQVFANGLAATLNESAEPLIAEINQIVTQLQQENHPLFGKRGVITDLNEAQVGEVRDRLFRTRQQAQQPSNPATEPQGQPGGQGTPGGVFGEIFSDYQAVGQRAAVQIASVIANQTAADVGVLLKTGNRMQLSNLAAQYDLGSTDYTGALANDFFDQLQGFQVQINAQPMALRPGATLNLLAASKPASSNPTLQSESSAETTESLG